MSTDNMRNWVSEAYPGEKWKKKVRGMPDNQVIAIYYHFLRDGVFTKKAPSRRAKKKEEVKPKEEMYFRQLDFLADHMI